MSRSGDGGEKARKASARRQLIAARNKHAIPRLLIGFGWKANLRALIKFLMLILTFIILFFFLP